MQVKFIEIVIYCNHLICFCIYLYAYAERMWDFMKKEEIIQQFFCFYTNKICMQALEAGKKREKKGAELLCFPEVP